jgi:membrane-associated phospholipid phosphatase
VTVLLVAAAVALSVDVRLAHWLAEGGLPGGLKTLCHLAEPFGHGMGVLVLLALLHQLDPARRWALPRVAACAWGAGMSANLIKMIVMRSRPRAADLSGDVWATFGDWLPGISAGSGGQSFPSAHTATAVGLAVALVWLYPRGRVVFPVLAALVACQRMAFSAHFLSDTLVGAALGLFVAHAMLDPGPIAAWFEQIELRWKTFGKQPLAADEEHRLTQQKQAADRDEADASREAA